MGEMGLALNVGCGYRVARLSTREATKKSKSDPNASPPVSLKKVEKN